MIEPYLQDSAYWEDEQKRLALALHCLLQWKQVRSEHPFDPMQGLVITEEEVASILAGFGSKDAAVPSELEDALEGLGRWERYIALRREATRAAGGSLAIDELADCFSLSRVERECVVLAMAAELDRSFEKLFGYANDDVTNRWPTFALAVRLLALLDLQVNTEDFALLDLLVQSSSLAELLAQDSQGAASMLARPLRLDERIVRFLLFRELKEQRLANVAKLYSAQGEQDAPPPLLGQQEWNARLGQWLEQQSERTDERLSVLLLTGAAGAGKKLHLRHAARRLGKALLVVRADRLGNELKQARELLALLRREIRLHGALLAVDGKGEWERQLQELPQLGLIWREFLEKLSVPVVWLGSEEDKLAGLPLPQEARVLAVQLPLPDVRLRAHLWRTWAQGPLWETAFDWLQIADRYQLSPGQIERAVQFAEQQAAWHETPVLPRHVQAAALAQSSHQLEQRARRLVPKQTFADLILPEEPKAMLMQAYYQMKYRSKVYGEWGFDRKLSYGKGLSMLFAGPPGTGKTMAAEVVAQALGLEVYKIDLSQMMSKYIGETEKNLHELYREAGRTQAVLFFDEADALFGKRSEVKDAHDKYANVETAYLLQKMEEYEGISILATNFQQNMDDAFMRRIQLIVKFPFPDAAQRELLWRAMLPQELPLEEGVDFAFLAQKLEFAGGNIKNIVVTASFLAAAEQTAVGMRHFIQAAKQELKKSGKILMPDEWDAFL